MRGEVSAERSALAEKEEEMKALLEAISRKNTEIHDLRFKLNRVAQTRQDSILSPLKVILGKRRAAHPLQEMTEKKSMRGAQLKQHAWKDLLQSQRTGGGAVPIANLDFPASDHHDIKPAENPHQSVQHLDLERSHDSESDSGQPQPALCLKED